MALSFWSVVQGWSRDLEIDGPGWPRERLEAPPSTCRFPSALDPGLFTRAYSGCHAQDRLPFPTTFLSGLCGRPWRLVRLRAFELGPRHRTSHQRGGGLLTSLATDPNDRRIKVASNRAVVLTPTDHLERRPIRQHHGANAGHGLRFGLLYLPAVLYHLPRRILPNANNESLKRDQNITLGSQTIAYRIECCLTSCPAR